MAQTDIAQAAVVATSAFTIDTSEPDVLTRWQASIRYRLESDPEGSFVSVHEGAVVGVAQAMIRERLWILSLLTVSPTLQRPGGGDGRALLNAALAYDRGTEAGIIMASDDPRALRLYGSSGFVLHPTFEARGKVDLARMPELDRGITEVEPDQVHTLAPISRALRGAAHTRELERDLSTGATIFRLGDRGFVVALPGRGASTLAARDQPAATALLWRALAHLQHDAETEISFITGAQQWALDVLMAARVPFHAYGAVAVRGNPGPLTPYIPSPPFG
jgi:GNAT superfamily N-acetyltransferase